MLLIAKVLLFILNVFAQMLQLLIKILFAQVLILSLGLIITGTAYVTTITRNELNKEKRL